MSEEGGEVGGIAGEALKIIAIRKVAEHERKEQEEILDLYKRALGMD